MKPRPLSVCFVLLLAVCAFFSNTITAQNITTVAGGGPAGGPVKTAFIAYPGQPVKDKAGNTYISSNWGHYVFKLNNSGKVSVFAGLGYAGFSGDGGAASKAALNTPGGLAFDSSGNLYIGDAGNNRVRKVDAKTGIITTIAGNSTPNQFNTGGYGGDGGPATQALLNSPYSIALDGQGNLFISDYLNFRIRRVDATTQVITTVAGTGTGGYSGDKGPATSAELYFALAVIVDKAGNLFIADSGNNRIRRVDAKTQVITTVAGNGTSGFSGDGGLATSAELSFPNDVKEDAAKNFYIIDTGNNRVRLVSAKTKKIKTIVGTGVAGFGGDGGPATKAKITDSSGGYVDSAGNLLIADSGNQRVRIVNKKGIINTLMGGGNAGDKGKATKALLSYPTAVAFDPSGNMYIAENGTPVVRKVSTGGTITTVAGTGSEGFSGDGGPATKAQIFALSGLAIDKLGNMFIADSGNYRVRRVDHSTQKISTYAGNGSPCSAPPACGDGGPATSANLSSVFALAVDRAGNLYIADANDNVIREVDASTGIINAYAGNYVKCTNGTSACGDGGPATSANLKRPYGIALDSAGNLYTADTGDNRIRRVDATTGIISGFAFTGQFNFTGDGGPALQATMAWPLAVAVDSTGNVLVGGGMFFRFGAGIEVVRKIDTSGNVNIFAGQENNPFTYGFSGDGGLATDALLNNFGLAVDGAGNAYIADSGNDRIRKVGP